MSFSVNTRVVVKAAPEAEYVPAHVYRYGEGYETNIPAEIRVDLGIELIMWLGIADARALVTTIGAALAAHEATESAACRVDLVKAVA